MKIEQFELTFKNLLPIKTSSKNPEMKEKMNLENEKKILPLQSKKKTFPSMTLPDANSKLLDIFLFLSLERERMW